MSPNQSPALINTIMLPEHPAANIARREPAAQEYVHDDRWSVGEVAGDAGSHSCMISPSLR